MRFMAYFAVQYLRRYCSRCSDEAPGLSRYMMHAAFVDRLQDFGLESTSPPATVALGYRRGPGDDRFIGHAE